MASGLHGEKDRGTIYQINTCEIQKSDLKNGIIFPRSSVPITFTTNIKWEKIT